MPPTKPMSDAMVEAVALRFRALSDPVRLRILHRLLSGELSVNDLAAATGLSQPNMSKHLATLRTAGFIERHKIGTTVYHAIADPIAHKLCDLMCARITAQARARLRSINAR